MDVLDTMFRAGERAAVLVDLGANGLNLVKKKLLGKKKRVEAPRLPLCGRYCGVHQAGSAGASCSQGDP
jgi:hypothetical protein